jgi:hypothetical protein
MPALRNVLLAANGLCFLLVAYVLMRGPDELRWLPILVLAYFVLDFIYLSQSPPQTEPPESSVSSETLVQ